MTEFRFRDGNVWLKNGRSYLVKNQCDNEGWYISQQLTKSGFEYPKRREIETTEKGDFICCKDLVNSWGRTILPPEQRITVGTLCWYTPPIKMSG